MDTTFLLNNLLKSDGTNQNQRLLAALNPAYIRIDGRGIRDILSFTYKLSQQINYYNAENNIESDWSGFFNYFVVDDDIPYDDDEILSMLQNKSDFDPHFALFLSFIQLFAFAQNDINNFTKNHLDFYYTKVLQLQPNPPVADKVHLILELAKNLLNHEISTGTVFKSLKDASGVPLYVSDNEIVVNKAQVQNIKSIFINNNTNGFSIYSADVANSVDGKGKPFTGTDIKWSGFGEDQSNKITSEQNMQPATVGFAFASPMLLLSGGGRTVTLTILFSNAVNAGDISNGIQLLITGEKGWLQPGTFSAVITTTNDGTSQLNINFTLSSTTDAVISFNNILHSGAFNTQWPVLQVQLTNGAYLYNQLYNLQVTSATIEVDVNGLKNLVLQNDLSQLDANKPFQPFGSIPIIGSDFFIGSSEIFQKKPTSFNINIQSNGVPQANLGNYYLSYFDKDKQSSQANIIFTVSVSLLYQGNWLKVMNKDTLPGGDYFLFNVNDATALNAITIGNDSLNTAFSGLMYERDITLPDLTTLDNNTHDGFVRIEITGPNDALIPFKAFGHNEYPGIYANRAIQIATTDKTQALPNSPYTPLIKSISLDYIASLQNVKFADSNNQEQLFYIELSGSVQVTGENPYLLPQYRNEALPPLSKDATNLYLGNMYLGVKDLIPPQNLSILFQVAEGSASVNTDIQDEDICWFYLADNEWIPLSTLEIITNTTNGFQTSGIISFSIGEDASNNNTLMPAGLYWLRAGITKDPSEVNQFIDIKTQAVEVSYTLPADSSLADLHLSQPLAASSINQLAAKDAAIKSVTQPYISFGGKTSEQDTVFYTRISERLRHKKRALQLWDYERLILNAFPEIFKVKCLTHTDDVTDITPGFVRVVVVPNLINKNSTNPLQPKVNNITINSIEAYVNNYLPVFVDFEADNPVYEQLLVDFSVGFMPGKDAGYYGNLLNEEIKKFLSPWAYEEGQDITFGGKIYKSDIIIFIENRPYVDFVNNFNFYHIFDGTDIDGPGIGSMAIGADFIIAEDVFPAIGDMEISSDFTGSNDFVVGSDTDVAVAGGPGSILVSAPIHRINVLRPGTGGCNLAVSLGIGFMILEENFIVSQGSI